MPHSARLLTALIVLLPALALAQQPGHDGDAIKAPPVKVASKNNDPASVPPPPWVQATPFDCNKPANTIETMVCQDDGLTRLDNRLEKVFAQAQQAAEENRPGALGKLLAEQRHWTRNLRDCLHNDDPHLCLGDTYILRISELQAHWGLASALTPLRYVCNGKRTILATFYRTRPATAKLTSGGNTVIVHQEPVSGSGARYQGQNVEFWIKGKEASVSWKGEPLECISQPTPPAP